MTYDRDEWRRPWREGDAPFVDAAPGLGSTAAAGHPAPGSSPGHPMAPAARTEDTTAWQDTTTSGATTTSGDTTGPLGEPTASPAMMRFPQPARIANAPTHPGADANDHASGPAGERRQRTASRGILRGGIIAALGGVVGALLVLAVTGGLDEAVDDPAGNVADGVSSDGNEAPTPLTIDPDSGSIVPAVAEAVTPSVVRIDVSGDDDVTVPGLGGGLGSGVIYSADGYIITNHHVVERAGDVTVRLANGDVLQAEVVGSDELNDIAVVKVERDELPTIAIRPDDEDLRVGETVVAIGSPFGLDASVSAGIISALDREIRLDESPSASGVLTIPAVVQTDAAINPGNSGGALVDGQGRLVGINTAILSGTGANQGVGFAVSAKQARRSADQLIAEGFVRHPLLGIAGTDVRPEDAEQLGLSSPRGAVVEVVEEQSGAAEADLRPGDVITELDGAPLATMSELVAQVRRRAPGDVIELEVVRDGEAFEVDVELGERPR